MNNTKFAYNKTLATVEARLANATSTEARLAVLSQLSDEEIEARGEFLGAIAELESQCIDHPTLAWLAEVTDPERPDGKLVDAELASRGLTREMV